MANENPKEAHVERIGEVWTELDDLESAITELERQTVNLIKACGPVLQLENPKGDEPAQKVELRTEIGGKISEQTIRVSEATVALVGAQERLEI